MVLTHPHVSKSQLSNMAAGLLLLAAKLVIELLARAGDAFWGQDGLTRLEGSGG